MTFDNQTTSTTCTSQPSSTSSNIELPLFYFENRGQPLRVDISYNVENTTSENTNTDNTILEFPIEIVQHFLISYSTWGDIQKLACVQKEWSTIVDDAANTSYNTKWSLAQSLLYGSNGVQRNQLKSLQLLKELCTVTTTSDDNTSDKQEEEDVNEYVIPALKLIAKLYLNGGIDNTSDDDDNDENTSENDTTTTTTTTTNTTMTEQSSQLTNDCNNNNISSIKNETDIQQDTTEGIEWLIKCYNIGKDAESAYELALIYEYGKYNVSIDIINAFEWFTKSATLGYVNAMTELALCYELGCGTDQNDTLAFDWYMKAAELGHDIAKFSIGEAFEIGTIGVPQNDSEACIWYYKAAINGCIDSSNALYRLYDIARIVLPGFNSETLSCLLRNV